jgi:hypothetical protein
LRPLSKRAHLSKAEYKTTNLSPNNSNFSPLAPNHLQKHKINHREEPQSQTDKHQEDKSQHRIFIRSFDIKKDDKTPISPNDKVDDANQQQLLKLGNPYQSYLVQLANTQKSEAQEVKMANPMTCVVQSPKVSLELSYNARKEGAALANFDAYLTNGKRDNVSAFAKSSLLSRQGTYFTMSQARAKHNGTHLSSPKVC